MEDETFGEDFVMDLFAQAELELAMERPWEVFTVYDETFSYTSGDTYLTNYTLPATALYLISLNLDRSISEYKEQIRMADRYRHQSNSKYFAVDFRNSRIHIMGTRNASGTAYVDYVFRPTYPVAGGTPPWPVPFRSVVAYRAAAILKGAVDADDISRVLSPNLSAAYNRVMNALLIWDGRLKQQGKSPVDVAVSQRDFPLQTVNLGV